METETACVMERASAAFFEGSATAVAVSVTLGGLGASAGAV